MDQALYNVVRMFKDRPGKRRIIFRGVTLDVAQLHCRSKETSSSTCTTAEAKRRTRRNGEWFDGYEVCKRRVGR